MSEESVNVVHELNARFNSGDESWIESYDPEAEFHMPPEWPDDPIYRGHEEIKRAAGLWLESFEEYHWDEARLIDRDDCVVGLYHHRGRIKGGDAWVEREVGAIWHLREGKVTRVVTFLSWNQTLEAAGVEGP